MEVNQSANPFDQIGNRLNRIEEALSRLISKEHPKDEKKYYTIAEAAKRLNVAKITLYRNGQAGKVPIKKIGSRIMVLGSFVDSQ